MKSVGHYAKILRVVLKEDIVLTDGWPEAIRGYLDSLDKVTVDDSVERRNDQRQDVEMSAIIRMQKKGNEVVYLPAMVKNISASGVMLEVQDKGHIMAASLDCIERFVVSFIIPGVAEPVSVECRPRHLEIRELVGVGAEFELLSAKSQKYVM